ncbi:type II toxin-antitoxin system HicB family antitoxin [Burkholderia gladioli]|uniref:type II toxin-antitoxin system HicB family antitoxin n=1 Tax=Burkholderia gladioli TaxID=28095 RepID=UPI003132C403
MPPRWFCRLTRTAWSGSSRPASRLDGRDPRLAGTLARYTGSNDGALSYRLGDGLYRTLRSSESVSRKNMEYPIYITRLGMHRYHGALPDFPAVQAAGGSYAELHALAARAVITCYDKQARLIPPPTTDMVILQASAFDTGKGIWRFVDIDIGGLRSTSLRVELCLPRQVVHDIDRMAKALGTTRELVVSLMCERGGHPACGVGPDRLAPAALPALPLM